MPFQKFSESMRDSSNRLDGFKTGQLVVDFDKQSVELEQVVQGKAVYLPLTEVDQIEVSHAGSYLLISIKELLITKATGSEWPLFAGVYARVKKI